MSRFVKRIFIIIIYLLIAGSILFLITRRYVDEPTCSDGEKNQREEGIDCGGPCDQCSEKMIVKKINIEDYHVVYGGPNLYDVIVKVNNPNERYGASEFEYTINLKNKSGEIVTSRKGKSFILPTETKYLIEIGLKSDENIASFNVDIEEGEWENFVDFEVPKVKIHNQKFGLIESETYFAQAFGLMVNDSSFDFRKIDINIIIRDSRGVPIAVGKTDKRTVDSGREYEFTWRWPDEFPGGKNMTTVEMQAEVNVFDNQNFMKKYSGESRLHELGQ